MAAYQYLERRDGDDAQTNFSYDMTGGSAVASFNFQVGDKTSLQFAVQDILGYTNPFAGPDQGLRRQIPQTHPIFPYMYANRIRKMLGRGVGTAQNVDPVVPTNLLIGNKPTAKYEKYSSYDVEIEYGSRNYPVLADNVFTSRTVSGSWYPKTGGASQSFTYCPEWFRYVDYDYTIQDNTVQGQIGNMHLWKNHKGIPFQNPPWLWLPDQILKITWYQVPYRFITSSNSYIAGTTLRNWRGRVNQNAWWNWDAGALLYLGYNVKKYAPPTNDIETDSRTTAVNYARLCDIELNFLLTRRAFVGSLGFAPTNGNYITAGNNLLPDLASASFFYATRSTDGTPSQQGAPAWFSFPAEALFSDPDVSGGPSTTGDN